MNNEQWRGVLNRIRNIPWKSLPAWLIGNRLRILMYHSISENRHDPHATTPKEFMRQMRLLQSEHVISLENGLQNLRENRSLKRNWVITFDDGLLDFYTVAVPILKEFGYPVTMFVPTGLVGAKSLWDSFDKTKPLMTWKQLEECQHWNVNFASHTVDHAHLTKCSDEALMDQLQLSLQTLKNRLPHVIPALAYPGGYHNGRVRQAAHAAGYDCALGASSRWGNGSESDFFQLRREHFN